MGGRVIRQNKPSMEHDNLAQTRLMRESLHLSLKQQVLQKRCYWSMINRELVLVDTVATQSCLETNYSRAQL
jgi:hypothetical protein